MLNLPIFPELSTEQQGRVIEVLQQITDKAQGPNETLSNSCITSQR